jgi:subtilisin family serine protease
MMKSSFFAAIFLLVLTAQAQEEVRSWILFKDKPVSLSKARDISERSYERRRRLNPAHLTDSLDQPVHSAYVRRLLEMGISIHNESRWLNAVTATLSQAEMIRIRSLPFVSSVQPVNKGRHDRTFVSEKNELPNETSSIDYGPSLRQHSMVNTPTVHALGYSGKGVRIGVIDTGFELAHPALQNLSVVADSDFVDNDGNVSECQVGDKGCFSHGTAVLSVIGSYLEGNIVGSAYGADYLLARTENDDGIGETAEEDNWIAALEWLERSGADIVTSSISFFDEFSGTNDDYTLNELDGKTALTTIATNIAFDKGVLVFNSSGNLGERGSGYLGTPSDGKKMIAVGAVYGDSMATDFSSRGPTRDGRTKPDIAALGVQVRVASGFDSYQNLGGTSLSTPMVAGIAALALEANPGWPVRRLYDAIRQSGHRADHPDPTIGRGVPNALKAIFYDPDLPSASPVVGVTSFPNPANTTVNIRFRALEAGTYSISIYNVLGEKVTALRNGQGVSRNEEVTVVWNGTNDNGRPVASGLYMYRITLNGSAISRKLLLVK